MPQLVSSISVSTTKIILFDVLIEYSNVEKTILHKYYNTSNISNSLEVYNTGDFSEWNLK